MPGAKSILFLFTLFTIFVFSNYLDSMPEETVSNRPSVVMFMGGNQNGRVLKNLGSYPRSQGANYDSYGAYYDSYGYPYQRPGRYVDNDPFSSFQNFFINNQGFDFTNCLLYTSPSPRDRQKSRMPSSA